VKAGSKKNRRARTDVPPVQSGPAAVRAMFDRIAPRYDMLNGLLSFRRATVWRRKVARFVRDDIPIRVLDLATGTGDQLIALARHLGNITGGIGIDRSDRMLDIGRDKMRCHGLENRFELRRGDATDIPFESESFDVVTISFGIRNVHDAHRTLAEMHRILKPGGRAMVLEFSLPESRSVRTLYLFYFRTILPWIGGWISGDREAYRYLNQTVESFPYGGQFVDRMRQAGFEGVEANPMTLGVVTIYVGDKGREG